MRELEVILSHQPRVVVAVEGLPGVGKTYLMKHIVRFGFGPFSRCDIAVIDDNTRYTTRLWQLQWTKLRIDKEVWPSIAAGLTARVIFFSNWIPSRYLPAADLTVRLKSADEHMRLERLRRRYRHAPQKADLQSQKGAVPWEMPFHCSREITIIDASQGILFWELRWLVRRCLHTGATVISPTGRDGHSTEKAKLRIPPSQRAKRR